MAKPTPSEKASSATESKPLKADRSQGGVALPIDYFFQSVADAKGKNEELQSVNEELQSANEELETSREELQSTNEELVTVNSEHQQKIDELNKSYNDINNLLESTEIATLFLNLNLCVRRFTPAVTRIINLRHTDVGRPISDITTLIQDTGINGLAVQVIEKLERKKMEVQDKKGRWYEMRLLPYRQGTMLSMRKKIATPTRRWPADCNVEKPWNLLR